MHINVNRMRLFLLVLAEVLGLALASVDGNASMDNEMDILKTAVGSLARQSMLTQQRIEEKTRMDGDSGIMQIRHHREGTKAYHSDTFANGPSVFGIHNHANNIRTIGLGELVTVLNGVQFRTRHNDFGLRSASTTSNEFKATTDIPYPDVPPEVLSKETVAEEIEEMREWFRAFRNQDSSVRDYRNYFKPVLCYMEGMWTYVSNDVDESFESDRHFIDAASWFELQNKIRYMAYAGAKDSAENLAYLPRAVINVTENGLPVFAQWNYGILCHMLNSTVPLDRLRMVDDLHVRLRSKRSFVDLANSRHARFQLNTANEAFNAENYERHQFLDTLMYQIPGKDNYGQVLRDSGMGDDDFRDIENPDLPLNAAQYHRAMVTSKKDAMGRKIHFRSFADENIYMAMTTQEKIAGISITTCKQQDCTTLHQKWTYAIPLEIIYLTPLTSWNPYDIPYRGSDRSTDEYKSVNADGRNGKQGSAYNGTNSKSYYITPNAFYDGTAGNEIDTDPADTTPPGVVYVLDSEGIERPTRAAGHRIVLPEIQGVGVICQRYPIAPIFASGNPMWKELEAVTELVMDPLSNNHLIYNPEQGINGSAINDHLAFNFRTRPATTEHQNHVHYFTLYANHIKELRNLNPVTVTTSSANGHVHMLELIARGGLISDIIYDTCDGRNRCKDGHQKRIEEVSETFA